MPFRRDDLGRNLEPKSTKTDEGQIDHIVFPTVEMIFIAGGAIQVAL